MSKLNYTSECHARHSHLHLTKHSDSSIFEGINFDNDLLSSPSPTLKRSISKIDHSPPLDDSAFDPDAIIEDTPPSSPKPGLLTAFTTGNGKPLKQPSEATLIKAQNLLQQDDITVTRNTRAQALDDLSSNYRNDQLSDDNEKTPFVGFVTAAGDPVPLPSQQAIDKAKDKFNDSTVDVKPLDDTKTDAEIIPPSPSASTPHQTKTPLPLHKQLLRNQQSTPFKSPLIHSNRQLDDSTTPKAARPRVGVGMSSNKPAKRQKFVTPFKQGVVPSPQLGVAAAKPIEKAVQINKQNTATCVFDLKCPSERKSMSNFGVRPRGYTLAYLSAVNIPHVVLHMNSQSANFFSFSPEATSIQAFADLKSRGCTNINQRWVDNHWRFIVWKLASVIRSCPSEMPRWSYDEVVRQLLYRYQREVNLAERSAVKRIQEHDSSSTRPMVLFVSQILDSKRLELSDGWYPIHATIDDCLSRAASNKKIREGSKMSIIGAKLNSGYDGTDVLDAVGTSNLSISGNSSSLARWDEKLGFQPPLTGFISSLRSLSPDGGIISLLDVVITSVFPLAYMDVEQNFGENAWSETEENKRLQEEQHRINQASESEAHKRSKEIEYVEDILIRLNDATANPLGSEDDVKHIDVEDELDDILGTADSKERIRKIKSLNGTVAASLAVFAGEKMNRLRKEPSESKVERRRVRNFRILRVEDSNKMRTEGTSAQLHVWDAITLNEDFKQGQRFKITNCNPTKVKQWPLSGNKKEVFLSTRRNSRFFQVYNR
ncbi:hypothetical protein E3P99_03756 [Wallemia hederae]|uniref:BRCA2 OB1 domain-containing protein n=1 Tax=Wallemia hederae TaxID=1540922 RepID=A0A4T0FHN0_9BASI|nr:hypothetical protein E3P99_03756 [Wallemia hederae]